MERGHPPSETPRPTLAGLTVTLRAPRDGDAEARLRLVVTPEIAAMFGVNREDLRPMTRADAERWVERLRAHSHAWVIEADRVAIGEIRLDRVDLQDRRASMAVAIYDAELLGKGLGCEAMELVIAHAFGALGLHRIGVRVLAYNTRAIRAYEKCGFVVEGRERETAFVDGAWRDDIMLGLLDREFTATRARN